MREPGRIALAFVVVAMTLSLATAIPAAGSAGADRAATAEPLQDAPEVDNTVTRIEVTRNGSARWSVTIRTRLENESAVEDYEAFQEEFRSNRETYRDRFERRMSGVVSNAENATGRNMTARDFRAETSIQEVPRRWGVVTYSFTWTNFAAPDGEALVVGDVFQGGLYLEDDDQFRLVSPLDFAAVETSPSPDEIEGSTRTWFGPRSFADERPAVRYEPSSAFATETETDGETVSSPTETDAEPSPAPADSRRPLLVGLPLLVALAIGAYAAWHRRTDRSLPIDREDDAVDESEEPARSPADADPSAEPVPDLAPDEDRVVALLERNGGRMRQADIADELEWSASKTSRVVSDMAEAGDVEKLRIGRENVIDLQESRERDRPTGGVSRRRVD